MALVGLAALLALAGTVPSLGPVPAVVGITVLAWWWRRRGRRRAAWELEVVEAALPAATDLILLGAAAGLSPLAAVTATTPFLPSPFRDAMDEVVRRTTAGEPFALAVDHVAARLGPPARPLVVALVAAGRDGGTLIAPLHRVADEARRRRRVELQARARRLPVAMLLPLVVCVLPAVVLIAIVPLVAVSLRDLGLGG